MDVSNDTSNVDKVTKVWKTEESYGPTARITILKQKGRTMKSSQLAVPSSSWIDLYAPISWKHKHALVDKAGTITTARYHHPRHHLYGMP